MDMVSSGYPIIDEPISAEASIPQSPSKAELLEETVLSEETTLLESEEAVSLELSFLFVLFVLLPPSFIITIIGTTKNMIKTQNQTLL